MGMDIFGVMVGAMSMVAMVYNLVKFVNKKRTGRRGKGTLRISYGRRTVPTALDYDLEGQIELDTNPIISKGGAEDSLEDVEGLSPSQTDTDDAESTVVTTASSKTAH